MSEDVIPEDIWKALESFEVITLRDLPKEALMERLDRKFIVSFDQIAPFLDKLDPVYKIVEAAGSVVAPYRSLYFDTENYDFYNKHRRGFANRIKVRYRSYPKTDTIFLEVKRKNNKSRTSKTRIIAQNFEFPLPAESKSFLSGLISEYSPERLQKTVEIEYDRLGFISNDGHERFSIDFDIRAKMDGKEVHFGELAIIEVKQDNYTSSPIIKHLRHLKIREGSMSKYCMALGLLKPDLKTNTFKPTLQRIRKIDKETIYET